MLMISRLVRYKDLLLVYIWREFLIRYRQSVIGVLWALLQPISMMLLFALVFGVILKTTHKDYPFALFFFAGILPWNFFSGTTNFSIGALSGNFHIITKIYFPREVIPLSGVAINFIDFLIGFFAFLLLIVFYGISFTWCFLWVFPLMALMVVFTASAALLLSSLNVYYRDVKLASTFVIQLLFFATPVVYSIDHVDSHWKFILFLNPMTFIVENLRRVTLEGRPVVIWQFLVEAVIVCALYVVIYKIFVRIERAFADVI